MLECKELQNDEDKGTLFIHGYWIPHLEELRTIGWIKQGKNKCVQLKFLGETEIEMTGVGICKYIGEVDSEGNAYGFGTATKEDFPY